MTTYLTESTAIYQSPEGNSKRDGQAILTVTLWAEDERIQNFGESLYDDVSDVRSKAAAAANKWDGLTGADVRAYDAFIRKIN